MGKYMIQMRHRSRGGGDAYQLFYSRASLVSAIINGEIPRIVNIKHHNEGNGGKNQLIRQELIDLLSIITTRRANPN